MSDPEREASRVWRSWRTAHEMVRDRGYEISDAEFNISLHDFKVRFCDSEGRPNRSMLTFKANPTPHMLSVHASLRPGGKPDCGAIWVEFNGEPSVGIKQAKGYVVRVKEANMHSGILVCLNPPSSACVKSFAAVEKEVHIEIFLEEQLLVNITKHELVPKHILLSKEEKRRLLARYRLKESQLPRIQKDDPIAKFLGLKKGNVVKIVRKSETSGRYASYRLCMG
ncbi:RNA polymerase [Geopyxis carbonaria]|nr:RNA polymerase [Geopyxis carbonaria]